MQGKNTALMTSMTNTDPQCSEDTMAVFSSYLVIKAQGYSIASRSCDRVAPYNCFTGQKGAILSQLRLWELHKLSSRRHTLE